MDARPFTHLAWMPAAASERLFLHWLRRLPEGASAGALSAPERVDRLRAAVAELGRDCALVPVEDGGAARGNLSRVHVPMSLPRIPLRHYPAELMPEVAPCHGLLDQARAWGFSEIVFVDHGGETALPLAHRLVEFHNAHRGRRCFVVGNGPSLNDIDMSRLRNEITLGSNRCFLGYPQWGFPFTYWGVYDHFQIEAYHDVYEARVPCDTVKFFPVEYLPVLRVAQGCPVNSIWPDPAPRAFSDSPDRIFRGFTVTYMLLQIAAIMGCDPIILIGTDHRYHLSRRGYSRWARTARRAVARRLRGGRVYEAGLAAARAWRRGGGGGPGAFWHTQDAAGATHFTAAYTDAGKNRFLPPEPEEAELDFACARRWAESSDRRILNATPGTALNSFEKVNFEDLFQGG